MKRARYTRGISFSLAPDQYEKIKSITDEQEISIAPDGHFKMPHLWPGQNAPATGLS
jgi:hypothetical protein